MTKVYIWPSFGGEDTGDGGVRRIVEAQRRLLPQHGLEIVETADEADVLAAHITAPPDFFTRYADKPLVAHNHGFYWSEFEWSGAWAERDNGEVMKLIKAADVITAPSEWVAQTIRRHSSRDVQVIYHGVDEAELRFPDDNIGDKTQSYVLWNKTRVDPVCDPLPVRQLAELLPEVPIHTTYFWPTEGQPVPANVGVLGRQPYSAALREVRRAGVYLATARETFGIGTLEALAAGVPVVGYRWGGQEEIIEHLVDGYLARPEDPADLARGVLWALKYRDAIAPHARAKAAAFGWDEPMHQYARLYNDLAHEAAALRPRVSIIVTAYNLAAYLPEALLSVQMQTAADWECIVVDDASPDDCGAIAEAFTILDPRFKVIHNETNQYLAEARNIGIRHASGRYILPLDADDALMPETVALLADALDSDRTIGVAYGGVQFINDDGTPTQYGHGREPGRSGWPVQFDLGQLMTRPGQPLPYASMFRREAWRTTGGYRRRVRSSEDCDLWMRLASYGFTPKMVTQAATLIYRNRPGSMSQSVGWADVENKTWFPWRERPELAPAAAKGGPVPVPSLDPPLISVVIPVGPGHEMLVRDAIDSVDAQTFRQWECIVVKDTGQLLAELPAWTRVVQTWPGPEPLNQEARDSIASAGVVAARNLGISVARAPYVLFLDADDYLQPDALALLFDAERETGRDIVYPDFWSEYADGRLVRENLSDFKCEALLAKALHAVTALYPRAALEEVGSFSSDVPWEDWDLQLKLAEAGYCFRRLAAPVWTYRKDTGKRREDRYARRDDGKNAMLVRWRDYIEGRKTLAGCSSCGANARTVFNAPAPARNAQFLSKPENMPDAVLIMFKGNGKPSFRGRATGTLYTFQNERPRYVHARDAENLLARPDMFPVNLQPVESLQGAAVPENAPVLTAPGPPAHGHLIGTIAPVEEIDVGRGEPLERPAARPIASGFDPSSIRVEDLPPPPPVRPDSVLQETSHPEVNALRKTENGPTEAELEAAVAPTGANIPNITNAANIAEIADDPESSSGRTPDLESGDGGSTPPSGASDDLVRVPINELGNNEDPPAERPAPKRPVGRPRTQPTKAKAKK